MLGHHGQAVQVGIALADVKEGAPSNFGPPAPNHAALGLEQLANRRLGLRMGARRRVELPLKLGVRGMDDMNHGGGVLCRSLADPETISLYCCRLLTGCH